MAADTVPVTVDNCNRAEFDMYFATSFNGQFGPASTA
jgi:hypothetical protein